MKREAFERLVSDWLDDPQSGDLRARLDAAGARDPQFARLREELVRVDALVRAGLAALLPVDWERLKARICARIAGTPDESTDLDEQLRSLPAIESHVDWLAFQRKVTRAIDQEEVRPRVLRLSPWRLTVAAGVLAAAAAVVLMLVQPPRLQPPTTPQRAPGLARMVILAQPAAQPDRQPPAGMARMQIIVDDEPQSDRLADSSQPDVFFMLEPPDAPLTMASAGGFRSP